MLHSFRVEVKTSNGNTKSSKWQEKNAEMMADFGSLVFSDQTAMLNKMGKEGWELVSTYTETGTSFQTLAIPNMSRDSVQIQERWL